MIRLEPRLQHTCMHGIPVIIENLQKRGLLHSAFQFFLPDDGDDDDDDDDDDDGLKYNFYGHLSTWLGYNRKLY